MNFSQSVITAHWSELQYSSWSCYLQTALDFVVAKDARMVLSCSYVEKFVHDNPLPQYLSRVCTLQNRT